jgi:hypothetical protein
MRHNLLFRRFAGLGSDDPVRGNVCPEICSVNGFQP